MQEQVLSKLQEVFDSVFLDKVVISPQLSAKAVPEWDSLKHIVLVLAVEKAFSIHFSTGEVEGTSNVGEFAHLIAQHLQNKSA